MYGCFMEEIYMTFLFGLLQGVVKYSTNSLIPPPPPPQPCHHNIFYSVFLSLSQREVFFVILVHLFMVTIFLFWIVSTEKQGKIKLILDPEGNNACLI